MSQTYEYFLDRFADSEGRNGGRFDTPCGIARLLVEMLEPHSGRIFDPCCGTGGMFARCAEFIELHGGQISDISIFGQEKNQAAWRLCKMNMIIRGIDADIAWGDSFSDEQFKDLKADFVLASPPFNDNDWAGEQLTADARWKHGTPPSGNANFAWVQNFIHHLLPTGTAGFVLANSSMSSNIHGEDNIRKSIIESDLVDCVVALPPQLFYNTMIPTCLWVISRNKKDHGTQKQILFIDAGHPGSMADKVHRKLAAHDIEKITKTYHAWRDRDKRYMDIPGFCKSASLENVRTQKHVIIPGRYVGAKAEKDSEIEEMNQLAAKHANESKKSDIEIRRDLASVEHGF